MVKEYERRDGEWGVNESKELNKDFQLCAAFLLQVILESIKFTMNRGKAKGTEQVRLLLSMLITNSKILCHLKESSVIFLIQMIVFLTNQVVIGEMQDRKSYL